MRADADSSRVSARRHRRVERALTEARRSRRGPPAGEDARVRKDAAYERYYAGRKASLDARSERLYAEADLIWDYIDALLRMTAEIRDESYEVEGYGLETAACCQIALQSFYEDRKETGGSR